MQYDYQKEPNFRDRCMTGKRSIDRGFHVTCQQMAVCLLWTRGTRRYIAWIYTLSSLILKYYNCKAFTA